MTVIAAVAVLVGVLALATVLGVVLRARTGRARSGRTDTHLTADLAPADAFGPAATLVQFSTPTCARCPATRRQLDAVADTTPGVTRIEIDLADRPELARRFDVMQTPTVLLLDADRTVRTRFGGPPRPAELSAALDTVLTPGTEESR
ncbi:TlpA family protein disulfide reductase [Curtobacterium pusillum]|uniref:TlpA family protein disulfide reductase n=1 Tax=Curtobacterium pusillum TaxID=69373 RepID=UPI0011A3A707|nr:thioredoxin family protein [Curtobacterium pusillum]